MDTKWMQPGLLRRSVRYLLQSMFLATVLIGPQAFAQKVVFEYGGQAHAESETRTAMHAAIAHSVLGQAPRSWGHVVFYRPHANGASLELRGDQAILGELSGGSYVVVAMAPGAHDFSVDGAALSLQVAPGAVYFIRTSDEAGNGAPRLHEVDMWAFARASRRFAGL